MVNWPFPVVVGEIPRDGEPNKQVVAEKLTDDLEKFKPTKFEEMFGHFGEALL